MRLGKRLWANFSQRDQQSSGEAVLYSRVHRIGQILLDDMNERIDDTAEAYCPPDSIDPERITVEFDKAAKAAMKQRLARIFRLSHCRDLSRVQFGIVFRHEPEIAHVGVIPAIARVIGY